MKTRTVADLRAARESRANEALKMKDEQLRILQDQNNQLLRNLDRCVLCVGCGHAYLLVCKTGSLMCDLHRMHGSWWPRSFKVCR